MTNRDLMRTPLMISSWHPLRSWLVAGFVGIALGIGLGFIRVALIPWIGSETPFALVFASIAVATALAGWRAGMVALLSGHALIWYAVFEPRNSFALNSGTSAAAMGVAILGELLVLAAITFYQKQVEAANSERDKLDKERQLVVQEMNHRVKNTLAVVGGMAVQTFKRAPSDLAAAFQSRLSALAKAHDLIAHESAVGADIASLLRACLSPYNPPDGNRIRLNGPLVPLSSAMAVNLALTANELATNATKYGSLSSPEGTVDICWAVLEGNVLMLEWVERKGPPVKAPTRKGFGTRLMQSGFGQQNGGTVEINFDPTGLSCRINAPLF